MARLVALVIWAVALAAASSSQERPDFSGTWKLDVRSSAAAMGRGGGSGRGTGQGGGLGLGPPPEIVTIQQDAATLTIAAGASGSSRPVVYKFDGSPTTNVVEVGGGGALVPATYRSHWDGAKLMTRIEMRLGNGGQRELQEMRSISSDGSMVVEISAVRGGQGRRSVYKK